MLIQKTPVAALDQAAQARLRAVASSLLMTNEAAHGYVMFEGKYISTTEVQVLAGNNRQFLRED